MVKKHLTRRRFLQALGVTAAAGTLPGCRTFPQMPDEI
ncbi:twin-arginine translocation signal domain-containing protein [Halomonas vilamensis]|uniref:Twin-arginine translocation signal domain-containing protein n=1 Tax=Vreelandella vilamensis TaxID=531309 RepID=A0ABU1H7M2_9GAMM|nr:twin-arginine translocation signal domain-containing protein [Halomonas vilamensis]MDR5900299.1 twin-arginine translocation signal domain-containing protein [Halomonas vilamensis]